MVSSFRICVRRMQESQGLKGFEVCNLWNGFEHFILVWANCLTDVLMLCRERLSLASLIFWMVIEKLCWLSADWLPCSLVTFVLWFLIARFASALSRVEQDRSLMQCSVYYSYFTIFLTALRLYYVVIKLEN